MKGNKEILMKYFGVMKDWSINWEEKEKKIKDFRKSFNKNLQVKSD